jgi:hypothetical protein
MQQTEKKQPLIPQFTIRWLLMLTAACAVVFSVFGLAVRGSGWAAGVSIAVVSVAVVLAVHASMFALVWAFSVATAGSRRGRASVRRSPFAQDQGAPRGEKDVPAAPTVLE